MDSNQTPPDHRSPKNKVRKQCDIIVEEVEKRRQGDQGVGMVFDENRRMNQFIGNIKGTKVCIDNLGWIFDKEQLFAELKRHVPGVVSITLGCVSIRGMLIHFGYGCVEFESVEAAIKGMIKLDSLYLDCPGCPFPRPILSHFPCWKTNVWGDGDVPGYVFKNLTSPHFCQPNTIERTAALEWKHLQRALRMKKQALCSSFSEKISCILQKYKSCCTHELEKSFHGVDFNPPQLSVLVYRGVSIELKSEGLRDLMEMSDRCTVKQAECPVTGKCKGSMFVDISDDAKAKSIAEDMDIYLFCLGRSPRPVQVNIVQFGPPPGFEGIFDRAVERVFEVKMENLKQSSFSNAHVVDISSWTNERRNCCEEIRTVMEEMQVVRFAWKLEANANRVDLHKRQSEWIHNEIRKLEKLEKVFHRIDEKENSKIDGRNG